MSPSQTIPMGSNVHDQSISDKDQHSQHSEPDHLQSDPCVVESTRTSYNGTYTNFLFLFQLACCHFGKYVVLLLAFCMLWSIDAKML